LGLWGSVLLGDREFSSVKPEVGFVKKVGFVLRIKQSRVTSKKNLRDYLRLSDLGLIPGTRFFLTVQITKQKDLAILMLLLIVT
jgi:hypothetical protein